MDQNNCSHTTTKPGYWRDGTDYDGEPTREYVDEEKISADKDIDLHRYQCSICGRVGYYSQAARKYHEEGILSPFIKGLGTPKEKQ